MPYDNVIRIMEMVSQFVEYHRKYPNILILGMELKAEMIKNVNTTTFISELEKIKGMVRGTGYKMFEIIAFTDDIEGFMVIYNTIR